MRAPGPSTGRRGTCHRVMVPSRRSQIAIAALAPIACCSAFSSPVVLGSVGSGRQPAKRPGESAKCYPSECISTKIAAKTADDESRVSFKLAELDVHSTYQTLFTTHNTKTRQPSWLRFTYDFDELVVGSDSSSSDLTTAIMLIHPIGVGIGKWYYDRLMGSLDTQYGGTDSRFVFISPDLLGSASACSPITETGDRLKKLPLLNISDWSEQIEELMADYEAKSESKGHAIENWCVVANGGCSPIALKVAQHAVECSAPFKGNVTNVVISSPPLLPFFLHNADPAKVQKSYRTLSGIVGRLFWWYALRRNGNFVQKFSEKNLVGKPENLGKDWTPNCVAAAKIDGGQSRYSTFAFLAGSLQDGCRESLRALKGSSVKIDFIRGTDKRRNRAKSWFWQRPRKKKTENVEGSKAVEKHNQERKNGDVTLETIQNYVQTNGNRGDVIYVGGRISLAHEDPIGYADALMKFISS